MVAGYGIRNLNSRNISGTYSFISFNSLLLRGLSMEQLTHHAPKQQQQYRTKNRASTVAPSILECREQRVIAGKYRARWQYDLLFISIGHLGQKC